MSNLKPRFLSSLPPRGSAGWLPALLVPLLVLVAVAQVLLPRDVTLPPPGAAGRGSRAPLPIAAGNVEIPLVLKRRPLFAPGAESGNDTAAADPLGGTIFVGTMQVSGRRVVLVKLPQGGLRYVVPGDEVAGWRVTRLGPDSVRLVRGTTEMTTAFGQRATVTDPNQSSEKDEQQ
jgi:hypothetical protein